MFFIEKNPDIIRVDVHNHLLKSFGNRDVNILVKEMQYEIIRNAYYKLNKKVL